MTRVVVPRGSTGSSSSSTNRAASGSSSVSSLPPLPHMSSNHLSSKEEETVDEPPQVVHGDDTRVEHDSSVDVKAEGTCSECFHIDGHTSAFSGMRISDPESDGDKPELLKQSNEVVIPGGHVFSDDIAGIDANQTARMSSHPPPPPVPPPVSSLNPGLWRSSSSIPAAPQSGLSRATARSVVSSRTSQSDSHPSSPKSHADNEGYNSADEQNPCSLSYDNSERERQFEIDLRRLKGLEVRRMLEDGNCLFRAVADQVYGDSEVHNPVRQMCIDYMEQERDHFSQFLTEGFTSYCKRKRRDKVYGNNMEIQAFAEMYNRPIHIYSYSAEPINIFHGNYSTDTPPIRLSYHHGNHYNSLVDPRRLAVGAGLGFSSLRGRNVDKEHVKAAIKAQQDEQIENALLEEGRFYSDLELTEKEIEKMVMEASRIEYVSGNKLKHQAGHRTEESSTSGAEPSCSGSVGSSRAHQMVQQSSSSSRSIQVVLSMGFSYLQVIEAYSIFGEDADSMVCYLLEIASRRKGKAAE